MAEPAHSRTLRILEHPIGTSRIEQEHHLSRTVHLLLTGIFKCLLTSQPLSADSRPGLVYCIKVSGILSAHLNRQRTLQTRRENSYSRVQAIVLCPILVNCICLTVLEFWLTFDLLHDGVGLVPEVMWLHQVASGCDVLLSDGMYALRVRNGGRGHVHVSIRKFRWGEINATALWTYNTTLSHTKLKQRGLTRNIILPLQICQRAGCGSCCPFILNI